MKTKLIPFLLLLFLLGGLQAEAQKIKQCKIDYDVEILESPDMDPMAQQMMKGMVMSMAFQDKASRIEMNMSMGSTVVIVDDAKKEGVVLMDMMGMKMATEMGPEDFEQNEDVDANYDVEITGKTKKIAGHQCKQAIVKAEGGDLEVWFTEDIEVEGTAPGYSYSKINGFPLQMETQQDGVHMRMTANKVSMDKMDDSMFDTSVPQGYQMMDPSMMGR